MAAETRTHGTAVFIGIALVAAGGLALSFVLSDPTERKYPDRIQVRMWHMWTGEWREVVEKIVDRYNNSPDNKTLALAIDDVISLRHGAFAPLHEQPAIRALLIPFGGVGAALFLETLATSF